MCLAIVMSCAGIVGADWTFEYADNFTTSQASSDSYRHSTFWTRDAVPLSEPYVYYIEISSNKGLAFVDFKGQLAELGYRFPLASGQAPRVVKGVLAVDVSFPSTTEISQQIPGRLEYRTSPDGMGWSAARTLSAGRQEILMTSASGVCYVLFSGTRAVIDNLAASLNSTPVTIQVPRHFATIQAAIDAAGDGDIVEVSPGTYAGSENRDIDFRGKAITVRSAAGPESTIIDCGGYAALGQGGHRGFYFHRQEGFDSVLSGFTIRSGRISGSNIPSDSQSWTSSAAHPVGGGIYCELSSPTIDNCIIEDCGAEVGGGIGVVGAEPTITDCVIEDCVAGGFGPAESGGRGGAVALIRNSNAIITNCILRSNAGHYNSTGTGLYFLQSTATVANCLIADNGDIAGVRGGGAFCSGSATDVTFRHCIFSQNRADMGAGIYAEGQRGQVRVINCTIAYNILLSSSPNAAAGIQSSGADMVVTNSILWSNAGRALAISGAASSEPVTYCDVQGGYSGQGNIDLDPLFASAPDDYHVKSKYGRYSLAGERWVVDGVQSPCIDAGDPLVSVGDEPVPNGNRINMGAYGGTKQASMGPEHSIFNVDAGRKYPGAYAKIQDAIDAAQNGDTILVWPGAYNESLVFRGKAITVQSAADAAVLTSSADYAVSFYHGEGGQSVLANFVIVGCRTGGIYCHGASPTLKNLTIVGNPYGVAAYDGAYPAITNCILWRNSMTDLYGCKARYSNVEHDVADTKVGNTRLDPLFANPDRSDYHLKSAAGRFIPQQGSWPPTGTWTFDSVTSPCIDAGDPADSCQGEYMPNGGRINMGAYGGTPSASKSKGG